MQLFCINSANLFPLPLTCKQRKLSDLLTLALIINRLRAIYLTLSYIYLTLGYETIVASFETIVAVRKNPKRADFCPKRADFFGQCSSVQRKMKLQEELTKENLSKVCGKG